MPLRLMLCAFILLALGGCQNPSRIQAASSHGMMALTLRWFWLPHGIFGKPVDMRTGGHAATLNEAKAQFETAWRQWLAWAKLQEMP